MASVDEFGRFGERGKSEKMGSGTSKYQVVHLDRVNPCFNREMSRDVCEGHALLLSRRCKMLMYAQLPVPSGSVGWMGCVFKGRRGFGLDFSFAVSRIRRESQWMAEGTLGLSTARAQSPFPSRGGGRNQRLRQRGRAGGWQVSVVKGTKISSHAKYLFKIHFGTENLVFVPCASSASRDPRGS